MKKAKNIIRNGFMRIVKSRHNKHIAAAAVAVLLAAAVVMTSVLSRTQAAENADTLMGIEKLRKQYSGGEEYTVLEIVPDINAAEIGYLFDGYEPVLSEWDSETMTWKSWKDILCGMSSIDDRRAFIEKKKEDLQAYYDAQGLKDNFPVDIPKEDYDDSEEYKEGYEEVEAGSYDMTGYFTPALSDNYNMGDYYVSFGIVNNLTQPETVYYKVNFVVKMTEGMADYIADGAYIYKKIGTMYECAGTWGQYKSSISLPPSSNEEDPNNDKDDNAGGGSGNGDSETGGEGGTGTGDSGDEGGNGGTGTGDSGDEGGETGTGEGNGGTGSSEEGGDGETGTGNGGTGSGNSETGSGESGGSNNSDSGVGSSENGNGSTGDSGSNSNASNSRAGAGNSADIKVINVSSNKANAGTASRNSVSQAKWLKLVSTDDAPKTSDAGNGGSKDDGNSSAASPENGQNGGSNNSSNDNQNGGADDITGDNSGGGAGDNTGDNQGGGAGDNTGDNQGGGAGDNTGDNEGGGAGDNTGDNQGGAGDNTGDNQGGGAGDNTGDNQGGGAGDNTGDNQGDDSDDNTGDNQGDDSDDNTGDNPDNDNDNPNKDSDKKPGKDENIQSSKAQSDSEEYYLVYFDRITDVTSNKDDAYAVKDIRPATYASYSGEPEHPTGQYNFEKDKEGDNVQTYTFPGRVLYCRGVFHNNEWFKQYVLNMSKDNFGNFKVKVVTLTPADLNNIYENGTEEYEKGAIPDFDFLYLNSGLRRFSVEITGGGDDSGNTGGDTKPDNSDDGGDAGDDNKPGNGEDGDNAGDDNKPGDGEDGDNAGDDNKPGDGEDGDNAGDDNKPGDGEDGDNAGDDSKPGNGDNSGNTGTTGDDSNPGNEDSKPDNGVTTGNSGNTNSEGNNSSTDSSVNAGNSNDSTAGTSNNNTAEGKGNTGNSSNAGSTENTANVASKAAATASKNASAWRTYVSTDDADSSTAQKPSDNKEDAGSSETDKKTADNTGDSNNSGGSGNAPAAPATPDNNKDANTDGIGDTSNTDDTSNAGKTEDTNNTEETGNTGDTDKTDETDGTGDAGNTDKTDETDGTGDADNTDKTDETDGTGDTGSTDETDGKTDKKNSTSSSIVVYNTANSDLDKDVANLLFTRVAAKALPCLVDGSILYGKEDGSGAITDKGEGNTENTQIFRLAAMLCQKTLEKDYTGVSKENLLKGIEDADKNFTTEQVYCRLGNGSDSIINDNFFKYTIYKEGGEIEEGFQNVLDEILLENLYRESDSSGNYKPLPTNIAQAEAVRHILNYQNRRKVEAKKSIKVLEIQPAYTAEPELTKKQLQKWAPGVEEVETDIMTTAEFIGKIEKLNEIYDLIYIGTSKEHLNIANWVTDTGKSKDGKYLGSTVFNDSDMDGLIYYNVGDKRVVNLPLSGLLDSEYKNGRTYFWNFARYSGNDITKEKKDALISFLNGSYPIIVSDEFIEQPATVFEDDDFGGRRATLAVGEYKESDLLANQVYAAAGTPAKGISSLQVKEGYQVTLFAEDEFKGAKITISSDVNNLTGYTNASNTLAGQTWNNRCRSMIVEKIEDAQPVRKIDGNHIDNSSYLYEFAKAALDKKYTNFYVKGDIDETGSELFKFYLNRPKANLKDFTANGIIGDSINGSSKVNDVYYIYPNTVGRYTLQYNFTIQNEGAASMDTRYNCKLYIDVNADGKFSDFEEVSDIVILNRQSGGGVSSGELYAGVPYTVTREVPNGYKGLLPWKIEVCQVNNDNIYASEQGYTKLNGMNKETLKVCQINKNTDNELRVIDLNYEIETEGRYFHTLVYGGDYGGVHYPGITADFELDVETIDIATFEKHYKAGDSDYNPDYLDGFNMLILGFSDAYDDFNGDYMDDATPLGAVVEFINSGKSVLMAHDTTSYFNNPVVDGIEQGYIERNKSEMKGVSNKRFAANINKYIRPLVGMDRYGVLSSPAVKKGAVQKEGSADWKELFSTGKEVAYKPKSARTETVPEAQGYTYAIINVRDTDENGNEKKDFTKYNLYSGDYNNREDFTNKYVNQRFDDVYYDDSNKDNGEINSANTSGKAKNVHVTQVNKGQITEYPYKLNEEFEVAQTHAQYYQLDYTADDDGDGQSDLVVWYCLGGRTSGSEAAQKTIYSQSPNDVRNNYYIYNKGNITYTGMGHGANDKKKKEDNLAYTFEEAKLFINTIIASYQAGVKPPTVTVLESGLPEASQLTTMYRYYDEAHMMSITDKANTEEYERVYFTVRDLNFVKGSRVIETHAYYHIDGIGGSENISVDGEEIPVIPLADNMFDAANDVPVDAHNLISGDIYYILVPKTVLSQCENGLDIYFEAQSTITTNTTKENVYTTDKVYAKLQVLRAYLFELD